MKKKSFLLPALALLTLAGTTSCTFVDASSQQSSSVPSQTQGYACTIVPDSYGTITTDKEIYALGESVKVTITAKDPNAVAPDALVVNGTEQALDGTALEVKMVEGGLVLKAEYRAVLTDFEVVSDNTSITITPISGAEYRLDDGEFQAGNVFTGLESGSTHDVSVRIAASGNLRASKIVTKTIATKTVEDLSLDLLDQLKKIGEDPLSLKGDFAIQRYLDGTFYDETVFDNELYFSSDRYYLRSSFQDDGTVKLFNETMKGEDGLCKNVYLNYDNTLVLQDIPNAASFDKTYFNPFADLTTDDIEKTDDGRFAIKMNSLPKSDGETMFSFLTTYADPLSSLYFTLDESGSLSAIEAYSTYDTEVNNPNGFGDSLLTYVERITLSVAAPESLDVSMPQEKDYDTTVLKMTMDLLAQGNYTADVVEEDFRQNVTSYSYRASGNDILVTSPTGYLYGYHDTDDGLVAYDLVSKNGSVALKGRRDYPQDGDVKGLLPAFDIDLSLFNPAGTNTYTLEGRFNVYQFVSRILPDRFLDVCRASEALPDKATISILSDSVVISYVYEDRYGYQGTVTSTLTNIGTTTAKYDFDALYAPYTSPTSWEELSPEFTKLLTDYIGDPSLLPFYWLPSELDNSENLLSYSFKESLEKTELELLTVFPNWDKATVYLDGYRDTLLDAGFEEYEDYHFRKGEISLFFSFPEVIGQAQRTVFLWIERV